MTAATATITPRWETMLAGLSRSVLRGDMIPRVRDRSGPLRVPHRGTSVTHARHPGVAAGLSGHSPNGLVAGFQVELFSSHPHLARSEPAFGGHLRDVRLVRVVTSDYHKLLPLCLFRAVLVLYLFTVGIDSDGPLGGGPFSEGTKPMWNEDWATQGAVQRDATG